MSNFLWKWSDAFNGKKKKKRNVAEIKCFPAWMEKQDF